MNAINEIPKRPPWHEGEVEIQRRVGVAERMATVGRKAIRDHMPDQHRRFYAQLPFVVVGTVAPDGAPWAGWLEGRPGFVTSPDPRTLTIAADPAEADPAGPGLRPGAAVGLLGIELPTRRRNRMNGTLQRVGSGEMVVTVDQAFGNCPKYISVRQEQPDAAPPGSVEPALRTDDLTGRMRRMIAEADTFFVASYLDEPERGRQVDVSHRGGPAGFVRVDAEGGLTIPDYSGNLFFNTLGNLLVNPRAGLMVPDFATGDALHLTGRVTLDFDGPEIAAFEGAERLWRFRTERAVLRPGGLATRWRRAEERGS